MNAITPVHDPRVTTCTSCGTPLASDQRYCLGCGARRDQARLPFQDAVAPATVLDPVRSGRPSGPPAAVPAAIWYPPSSNGASTATVLAALACVLLAFGVGLLVGGGDGDPQPPVVIGGAVPAASGAAGPPATTGDTAGTAPDAEPAAERDRTDAADHAAEVESTAPADVAAEDRVAAKEVEKTSTTVEKAAPVSESVAKDLTSDDPDKAREASQSLPDVVSLGE